jgi:hypothetical protein
MMRCAACGYGYDPETNCAREETLIAYQKWEATERRLRIEDTRFLTIALNLGGERDKLETQAADLINAAGYRRALQLSSRRLEAR